MHLSKSYCLNSAPCFIQLFVQHNVMLVKMVKTASNPPHPAAVSSNDKQKEKQSRTREKTVKLSSGISEHDLNIKMSHVREWLEKGFHVSVLISKNANKHEVSATEVGKGHSWAWSGWPKPPPLPFKKKNSKTKTTSIYNIHIAH